MMRTYARIVGVLLVLTGLAGFVGAVDTDGGADFYHMAVGGIFVYLGFWQRDAVVVRRVVGGMGVLLLLIKGAIILAPLAWGEGLLLGPIEITCLVVGILSVLAARYLRDAPPTSG